MLQLLFKNIFFTRELEMALHTLLFRWKKCLKSAILVIENKGFA